MFNNDEKVLPTDYTLEQGDNGDSGSITLNRRNAHSRHCTKQDYPQQGYFWVLQQIASAGPAILTFRCGHDHTTSGYPSRHGECQTRKSIYRREVSNIRWASVRNMEASELYQPQTVTTKSK